MILVVSPWKLSSIGLMCMIEFLAGPREWQGASFIHEPQVSAEDERRQTGHGESGEGDCPARPGFRSTWTTSPVDSNCFVACKTVVFKAGNLIILRKLYHFFIPATCFVSDYVKTKCLGCESGYEVLYWRVLSTTPVSYQFRYSRLGRPDAWLSWFYLRFQGALKAWQVQKEATKDSTILRWFARSMLYEEDSWFWHSATTSF